MRLLAALLLASCATPMRLVVKCNDRLMILADIVPGATEVTGSSQSVRTYKGDSTYETEVECVASLTERRP